MRSRPSRPSRFGCNDSKLDPRSQGPSQHGAEIKRTLSEGHAPGRSSASGGSHLAKIFSNQGALSRNLISGSETWRLTWSCYHPIGLHPGFKQFRYMVAEVHLTSRSPRWPWLSCRDWPPCQWLSVSARSTRRSSLPLEPRPPKPVTRAGPGIASEPGLQGPSRSQGRLRRSVIRP
jgi:hypothetical protein